MRLNENRLPVRKRIRLPLDQYDNTHVFSITISTHERYEWFARYAGLSEALVGIIRETARERRAGLFAWCVMPEHLHLALRDSNIRDFVRLIKGRCTPIARRYDRTRRLWQRSFHDRGVRREESLISVARYVLNNPVRAGLVADAAAYPWSGSDAWPQWRLDDWSKIEVEVTNLFGEE